MQGDIKVINKTTEEETLYAGITMVAELKGFGLYVLFKDKKFVADIKMSDYKVEEVS